MNPFAQIDNLLVSVLGLATTVSGNKSSPRNQFTPYLKPQGIPVRRQLPNEMVENHALDQA